MTSITTFEDRSNPINDDESTRSNEKDLVQVPSKLLDSLIASIDGLRKDVAQLRDENTGLASELQRL